MNFARHQRSRSRLDGSAHRWGRLALVVLALVVSGCGGTSIVPLEQLALEAEEYSGRNVTTHGMVAEFGEPDGAIERHFVLQDADEHRVRLLPDEAAESHVGSMVEVTGAFQYDQTRGRALHIDTIESSSP